MAKIRAITIFLLIFSGGASYSQDEFSGGSPYTIFGVGDINYFTSARTYTMGVLGISLFGNYVNNLNPAANTKLRYTMVSTAFNYGFLKSTDGVTNNRVSNGNVTGINIGIPFNQNNGWIFSIGFNPVSQMNYEIQTLGNINGNNYTQTYSGKGGVSRINAAMTYNVFKAISLGFEFNYAFGEIKTRNAITFTGTGFTNTEITHENDLNGNFFKGGLVLDFGKISNNRSIRNLSVGFIYESQLNLSSDVEAIYRTSISTDSIILRSGEIVIPQRFGFGISNLFGDRYMVSADLIMQDWSKYSDYGRTFSNYGTTIRTGLGVDILPKGDPASFWSNVSYRLGAFYDKAYYKLNDEDILSYGLSAGMNIPISPMNTLDIGITAGMRGKTGNNLIKDEFITLTGALNLGELWFIRPRDEDR
jgi:hypothetical protein